MNLNEKKATLTTILFKHDPIGFARMRCPDDEYEIEASPIIDRLFTGVERDEIASLVKCVFVEKFGREQEHPAFQPIYDAIADEMWSLWSDEIIASNEKVLAEELEDVSDEDHWG